MSNKNVLCKLSIPLYCCTCLNKDGTFIVAGGGGAAKTGVRNCVVSIHNFYPLVKRGFVMIFFIWIDRCGIDRRPQPNLV